MAKAKQVIDFRASKGITKAQSNEHQRVYTDRTKENALSRGNYDLTRDHLNFEVTKGGIIRPIDKSRSIPQMMADNLLRRGIKDPNEGLEEPKFRTVVNFILGGSRERMLELAFGNQQVNMDKGADNSHIRRSKDIEQWAKDMYDFMCKQYGEDNVIAFYVHLDELNPHCHCTVLPIDENNRFSYKKIFAGKDKFEYRRKTLALHDALAKVNEKWGLGRGTSITETGARHRSTEEYRRYLDEECTDLKEKILNHKKALSELYVQIQLAEKRSKGLTTMISNLQKEKSEVQGELDKLHELIRNTKGDKVYLELQKAKLEKTLHEIDGKLADKNNKLEEADQKLSKLKADFQEIEQRANELKQEAADSAVVVKNNIHELLNRTMFDNVVNDFRLRMELFDDNTLNRLDDSLIMDVAEKGDQIVTCAAYLFAGYIDQAVTFAKGHGGGGGTNLSGWGRDPKDDDKEWARRCLSMACKLMKSASGKRMKR